MQACIRRRALDRKGSVVAGLGALPAIPGGIIPAAIVLKAGATDTVNPITVSPPWLILVASSSVCRYWLPQARRS